MLRPASATEYRLGSGVIALLCMKLILLGDAGRFRELDLVLNLFLTCLSYRINLS